MHDTNDILGRARQDQLRTVRFLYCDHANVVRGKSAHAAALADCLESGIGLTVAMQAFCLTEHLAPGTRLGPVGERRPRVVRHRSASRPRRPSYPA